MRIPLDYYRILGVPIGASTGQISQAYHDRALQLPRREYSDAAITARSQLLDEAYAVLSDSERHSQYDANFLVKTKADETKQQVELPSLEQGKSEDHPIAIPTPLIEIEKEQFVGALLIFLELGEYELVLKLGYPELENSNNKSDRSCGNDPQLVRADLVLSLALACLEMGREQWQQGQYENAAISGEIGHKLLLQEGLFPGIQEEIKVDYNKLRPYRILELLALSSDRIAQRSKGLQLLKQMLQERGGIDGAGDDHSGLSIDDFLRFIQQLRSYLTVEEQLELFEAEARRPSAVATFLAVYALIARGFADRLPALILRAKEKLLRLGRHQDVYLEQALCSLLLGQTEEASYALELSQEHEPLDQIREHSQGAPDLLPGLCLYAENWLQTEVFPHFRDLAKLQPSLQDYFADQEVQTYLEQLSGETEEVERIPAVRNSASDQQQELVVNSMGKPNTKDKNNWASLTPASARLQKAISSSHSPRRQRRKQRRFGTKLLAPLRKYRDSAASFPRLLGRVHSKNGRILLLALLGVLGIGVASVVARGIYQLLEESAQNPSTTVSEPEQLFIGLNQPPVEIPPPSGTPATPQGLLSEAVAQQTISSWLSAKAKALGQEHQIEQLNTILLEPILSKWRGTATNLKQNKSYWQYQHNVKVESVKTSKEQPNQATVDAAVKEDAKFYSAGQLNQSASYNDNLRVRYDLVRQNGQWRIKDINVLQ